MQRPRPGTRPLLSAAPSSVFPDRWPPRTGEERLEGGFEHLLVARPTALRGRHARQRTRAFLVDRLPTAVVRRPRFVFDAVDRAARVVAFFRDRVVAAFVVALRGR